MSNEKIIEKILENQIAIMSSIGLPYMSSERIENTEDLLDEIRDKQDGNCTKDEEVKE